MKKQKVFFVSFFAWVMGLWGALTAQALDNYYWTNDTGGVWSDGNSWVGDFGPSVPAAGGSTSYAIIFTNTGSSVFVTNDLGQPDFLLNQLQFAAGSSGVTIFGGAGTNLVFTNLATGELPQLLQDSAAAITINHDLTLATNTAFAGSGSGVVTINGGINGPGSLDFNGGYTLVLAGAKTYSGPTTISGGTLWLSNTTAFASSSITNNAALIITLDGVNAFTYGNALAGAGTLTKTGTGALTLSGGNIVYTGPTTISGGVLALSNTTAFVGSSITNNAGLTVTLDGINALTYGTSLSGSGALTKTGAGTLTLSGGNIVYTGPTTISGGVLVLSNTTAFVGSSITNNAGLTVTLDGVNALGYNNVIAGSGALTKNGAGTLTLGGPNTYSGGTLISNGVIFISADNNLGAGNTNLTLAGGTLRATNTFTLNNRAIILGAGASTFNVDANSTLTITNTSATTGNWVKAGSGTMTLAYPNPTGAWAGQVIVSNGTLNLSQTTGDAFGLNGSNSIIVANGGKVVQTVLNNINDCIITVNNGGIYDAKADSIGIINSTDAGGVVTNAGGFTFRNVIGTYTWNGSMVGASGVTLQGGSGGNLTWVLGGTNTYSGVTQIGSTNSTKIETLIISNAQALAHGAGKGNVNIETNGVLDLSGNSISLNGIGDVVAGRGGLVTNGSATAVTLTVGDANTTVQTTSSIRQGAGIINLVKIGSGTWTLAGTNSLTGSTLISAGAIVANSANVLGTGPLTMAYGTALAPVVFNNNGFAQQLGTLYAGSFGLGVNGYGGGAVITNGNATLATLTIGSDNGTGLFMGNIGGTNAVTKIGTGTQQLGGFLGQSGATTISNGTLALVNGAMIMNNVVVTNGATLTAIGGNSGLLGQYYNYGPGSTWPTGYTTIASINAILAPMTPTLEAASSASGAQNAFNFNQSTGVGTYFPMNYGSTGTGPAMFTRFNGKFIAPTNGTYYFETQSDDGSMLFIDGVAVVNNDGSHGIQGRSNTVYLTTGLHEMVITYGNGAAGGYGLWANVALPGGTTNFLPNSLLSYGPQIGTLVGDAATALQLSNTVLTVNQASNGVFNGNIVNAAPSDIFYKAGAGLLALGGVNSNYTGTMIANAGVLQFNATNAVPTVAGGITINPAGAVAFDFAGVQNMLATRVNPTSWGVLAVTTNTAAETMDFNTPGFSNAFLGAFGTINYTGNFTPQGNIYRLGGAGGTLVYTPAISNGTVIIGSPLLGATNVLSTVMLTGNNTYGGSTTINPQYTLQIGNNTASGSVGSGNVSNLWVLQFLRSDAYTFSNNIVTASTVKQLNGSGQLTFAGTNNFGNLYIGSGNSSAPVVLGGNFSNSAGNVYIGGANLGVGSYGKLVVQDNAMLQAGYLSIGDNGGTTSEVYQSGGTITVSSTVRVGHYGTSTGTYTMVGGSLLLTGSSGSNPFTAGATEQSGALYLGIDGAGMFNQSGGTVSAQGLVLDNRGDTAGIDTYTLTGGRLILGTWGIQGNNSTLFNAGGGTISASANWTALRPLNLTNITGGSVFDAAGYTITINSNLYGPGALQQAGTGTLVLNGSNTYSGGTYLSGGTMIFNGTNANTGGTFVNGGILQVNITNAVPVGTFVTLNNGGALAATGAFTTVTAWLGSNRIATNSAGAIALVGNSAETIDLTTANGGVYSNLSLGATGNFTYTGLLTPLNNTYRLGGGGGTLTYPAAITNGSVFISGQGFVLLNNQNTFTGGLTLGSGELIAASDGSLGNATGAVNFAGGLLQVGTTINNLNNRTVNWGSFTGGFDVVAGGTFVVNTNIGGSGSLTKAGPGYLVLLGSNSYAGGTTVSNGTLRLLAGNGNNLLNPNAPIALVRGTLDLAGNSQTLNTNLTMLNGVIQNGTLTIADTNFNAKPASSAPTSFCKATVTWSRMAPAS